MNSLRILVVDDEPLARKRLGRLLRAAGCEVLDELRNVPDLLARLEEGPRPDALFLDIEMPGGTGMEALAELDPPLPVVFVTAYPEHAARAFEVDAVDYLLKPVFKDRIEKSLEKLRRHLAPAAAPASPATSTPAPAPPATAPLRFPARAAGGHFFLEFRKVSHFEFDEHAVWAWLGGQRFRAPWESLGEVEEAFPGQGLLRIQRHLLVRPEAILSHRPLLNGRAQVRLADGTELEVSRSMTPRLREILGIGKG
ncbi:MAG: response regulator transcription factor [Holophagaceae bacterium]|nr:response regulator transcription factor [Holophagaceae bacterium]